MDRGVDQDVVLGMTFWPVVSAMEGSETGRDIDDKVEDEAALDGYFVYALSTKIVVESQEQK